MSINERVKALRKTLNMKQLDFAKELTISQGHLSDIENGRKEVSNKIQEIIILKFNVNESWLHSGKKPIFINSKMTSLDDYAKQKGATKFELDIIKSYLNIPKELRHSLEEYFKAEILPNLRENITHDEDCACEYVNDEDKSIEERVAEAEREYETKVLGMNQEQVELKDKIKSFNESKKLNKEHA